MGSSASHIVNFGFLLGLVVVTSVTLPDHQKEAGSSETVMKPIETTDHVNMDAKMPVMPQLALVAVHAYLLAKTHLRVFLYQLNSPNSQRYRKANLNKNKECLE